MVEGTEFTTVTCEASTSSSPVRMLEKEKERGGSRVNTLILISMRVTI